MTNNYNNLLFLSLLKKYKKYFSQLDKKIKNGTFAKMAAYQRQSLVKKVEQLRSKLNGFQLSALKYGAAAAFLLTIGTASAQGPYDFNHVKNPFPKPAGSTDLIDYDAGGYEISTFADLDNDGDLDMVGGNYYDFVYFQNNGTASVPDFVQQTGTNNPFDGFSSSSSRVVPTLGDFDNDGDFDMVSGIGNGGFLYFENTGTASAPAFTELTGSFNPLDALDLGDDSVPSAVDVDADGDMDLIVGESYYGNIYCFLNTVSATAPDPIFAQATGTFNPFSTLNPIMPFYGAPVPSMVDIDDDGDLDAFIGNTSRNTLWFLRKDGTGTAAYFAMITGSNDPLNSFYSEPYKGVYPTFADIDNDGDYDFLVGDGSGEFLYYQNIGNASAASYGDMASEGLSDQTFMYATQLSVDIDNDGDEDAFVGKEDGRVLYFENTGNASMPVLIQRTGPANPLDVLDVGYLSSLAAADLDGDGDMDILAGGSYFDKLYYFENVGSVSVPSFAARTGASNPFDFITTDYTKRVKLEDIDNDGDIDFMLSTQGAIEFYENTGSATMATFTSVTGANNPFDGITGMELTYELVDLDKDGDLDLVTGDRSGLLRYYQNNGSASLANFDQVTGTANPFNDAVVDQTNALVAPDFWDFDADGDFDLFLGMEEGSILLYERVGVVTSVLAAGPSLKATAVEVYPNPTVGSFTISVPSELSGAALITISDLSGRQLFSERRELQSGDLSYEQVLSDKQPGTYVLKIVMDNRVGVAKIVKQ